jgi:hypothetical protein
MIAQHIDGMLEEAVEHLTTLQEAIPKPYELESGAGSQGVSP